MVVMFAVFLQYTVCTADSVCDISCFIILSFTVTCHFKNKGEYMLQLKL